MACCGKPNTRGVAGAAAYYQRYGYLTKEQLKEKERLLGTNCPTCQALTQGDPCSVCNNPKTPPAPSNPEGEKKEE